MIKQLRPIWTESQLLRLYDHQFDSTLQHSERIQKTIEILDAFAKDVDAKTVADLSCGDGAILNGSQHPWQTKYLGDFTTTGPIDKTLMTIPQVDMFVCSETLEHLEDPGLTLYGIRCQARHLLLSTPTGEVDDKNPEHIWGWDEQGIGELLADAGWSHRSYVLFTQSPPLDKYTFQIWTCSR